MRCLVTGGAGFIGSHLVAELLRRGHSVRVLDNMATGSPENIQSLQGPLEDVIVSDVRDLSALRRAFQDVDVVFHYAAVTSIPRSVEDPLLFHEVNATGTLNVLLAAREQRVRRVVYASTSSVYGSSPQQEEEAPSPASPYGATKLAGEVYCRTFTQSYGLETIALRYFTVFGPRQRASSGYGSAIPTFITQILTHQIPTIYGDGTQARDFLHVANAVHAAILAMASLNGTGQAFNVGSGETYTVLDLIASINQALGTSVRPTFAPSRPGDVHRLVPDLRAVKEVLGYRPVKSFSDGLSDTVAWFRQNLGARA